MTKLSQGWLSALRRYLAVFAVGNLVWETVQMPLYTLWRTGSARDIAFAIIHCTGGDVLIGGTSLIGSLLLFGATDWPTSRFLQVAAPSVIVGLTSTVFSEHLNLARNAWTYSDLMPTLPRVGTGLAPLAQWFVVPGLALVAMRCPWARSAEDPSRLQHRRWARSRSPNSGAKSSRAP